MSGPIGYQFKKDYYESNPANKDAEWATRLIRDFRTWMVPFCDSLHYNLNMSYLEGRQDMTKHKKKFRKPDKLPFEFKPLAIFEKYKNILVSEREKAGVYISMNALDPSAQEDRKHDMLLLQNRGMIEGVMNYVHQGVDSPPYSLMKDKDENGDKLFNGNVEQFDQMGLDANDPEDVAFFFETFHRLDVESETESIVNFFGRYHELQEQLKLWMPDIMAVKRCAARVFADETTFTPSFEYLRPDEVRWIPGKRQDGKDSKAISCEKNMNVQDFLARVGTEVNSDQLQDILDAVNFHMGTNGGRYGTYDGIAMSDGSVVSARDRTVIDTEAVNMQCTNTINYDVFLNMKIAVGYVEWKSADVETTKEGINTLGNFKRWQVEPDYDVQSPHYQKKSIWNMRTYKAYYLMTTSGTQQIYKFGPLYDMYTYGPEDEYSGFSFQLYLEKGPSAIDVSIPHIDNSHDAWFRFNWILNRAKPRGTRYNYDVMVKIASKIYKDLPESNSVIKLIELFQEGIDDFYTTDATNPKLGGGQNPHFDKPNGIDPAIKEFAAIIAEQQTLIADKLGVNSIREAYSPAPNDGYKLQMQALAQSRNATEYMSRMLMSMLDNYAHYVTAIVQDMIEFEGSRAYKFLMKAVGAKAVLTLRTLKKVPLHKYGIFIETFNTDLERQEKKQQFYEAFQKGQIPYHVFLLLENMDNFKKAAKILSYELNKAEKRKRKEAEVAQQNALQLAAAKHKMDMEQINAKNQGPIQAAQITAKGMYMTAQLNNKTKEDIKQMGIEAEPGKNANRADNSIREHDAKHQIDKNAPIDLNDA